MVVAFPSFIIIFIMIIIFIGYRKHSTVKIPTHSSFGTCPMTSWG